MPFESDCKDLECSTDVYSFESECGDYTYEVSIFSYGIYIEKTMKDGYVEDFQINNKDFLQVLNLFVNYHNQENS